MFENRTLTTNYNLLRQEKVRGEDCDVRNGDGPPLHI